MIIDWAHLGEWLHLAVRWFHFMVGVAWIGASFYFIWLNNALLRPDPPQPGVEGEVWALHGGGYYNIRKFHPAMDKLPSPLHWFKWEAYLTFLSGLALITLTYWARPSLKMVREGGPGPLAAVGIGVSTLVGGWIVYDLLCRSPLAKKPTLLAGVGLGLITALGFGLTQVLSGQAAFMHVGAMIGTIMAGNVAMVIIPGQKAMVQETLAGRPADPERGKIAGLRSLHNNYLTLPVLFVMISNHFPMTFGHSWNWLILAAISVIGMVVRHHVNLEDQGRPLHWLGPLGALGLLGLALVTQPHARAPGLASASDPSTVYRIIAERCAPCHAATPTHSGFAAPPKGMVLETVQQIEQHKADIRRVAVDTDFMPLGNLTHITDDERGVLDDWSL